MSLSAGSEENPLVFDTAYPMQHSILKYVRQARTLKFTDLYTVPLMHEHFERAKILGLACELVNYTTFLEMWNSPTPFRQAP
jgi:hypothetical protein